MTLFLSDLHLGRGTAAETRAAEQDLLALLRAHERAIVDEGASLYLVGDVFDQYLEYRHLVPKTGLRLLGLLADWADRGAAITYLVGNRDPWHVDVFERDLGVRLVRTAATDEVEGHRTYIAHGDGFLASNPLVARVRQALRHPAVARLYRLALPGDGGYALARWAGRRFGSAGAVHHSDCDALRAHAMRLLDDPALDLVVLGHGHRAECILTPAGAYLNPGYWFADRTFARLDAEGPTLLRWHEGRAEPLATPADAQFATL